MPLPVDEIRDLYPHFPDEYRAIQLVDSRTQMLEPPNPSPHCCCPASCGKKGQAKGGS